MLYQSIVEKLKQAKESNDQKKIHESLLFFVNQIYDLVKVGDNFSSLSDFVEDKDYVFAVQKTILSKSDADLKIHTKGLVNELLQLSNIGDSETLSEKFNDSILDLYSAYSASNDTKDYQQNIKAFLIDFTEKFLN